MKTETYITLHVTAQELERLINLVANYRAIVNDDINRELYDGLVSAQQELQEAPFLSDSVINVYDRATGNELTED